RFDPELESNLWQTRLHPVSMRVAAGREPRRPGRSAGDDQPQPTGIVSRRTQEVRRTGRPAFLPDARLYARTRLPGDGRAAGISRLARRDGAEARRPRVPGQGCAAAPRDVSRDVSESRQVAGGEGRRRSRQPLLVEPVAQAWDVSRLKDGASALARCQK